jgi:hypothetical protein
MPPSFSDAVPMPPFIARWMPKSLPTVAPRPAPALPWAGGSLRAAPGRPRSRCRHRGGCGVADPQVEQHRRRHDGHARRAHLQAVAAFVQPAHHAAGGVQPEGAAAGQQHRVHAVHGVFGAQQVGLARAGRAAAHVDAAGHALGAQHHGAAGGRPAAAA